MTLSVSCPMPLKAFKNKINFPVTPLFLTRFDSISSPGTGFPSQIRDVSLNVKKMAVSCA